MSVDRALGLGAVCLAVPVLIASWSYGVGRFTSPGAGFWPFYVAVAMLGLAAALILRPTASTGRAEGSRWVKFAVGLATLVFYVVALEPLGYFLATVALMVVQFRWVEDRPWRASATIALVASGLSLVVFRTLLHVPLPVGLLPLPKGW